ncbi:MAG TPA: oxidoreductase [Actinobacteria bacterium]|nr:oxidoreductase [Actinomycetota bacterium]
MIRLDDTSGGAVAAAIAAERHRNGSPATGMVLTLLILSDEEYQADATSGAVAAARQHPMRIVTLVPRPSRHEPRLDAEIAVGGDDGPGEVAVLRLRGDLAGHASSVAIPLLLSDTPVVAYWPSDAPDVPLDDAIGRHAQRRITDTSTAEDIYQELARRKAGYRPGDTDLSWTRLTPWRSALASAMDQGGFQPDGASISAEADNPSALLLQAWLNQALGVPVELTTSPGPGITSVTLHSARGEIAVSRPSGDTALLTRPGVAEARIAMARRGIAGLLSEELRRLDPDEVYGSVLQHLALP